MDCLSICSSSLSSGGFFCFCFCLFVCFSVGFFFCAGGGGGGGGVAGGCRTSRTFLAL